MLASWGLLCLGIEALLNELKARDPLSKSNAEVTADLSDYGWCEHASETFCIHLTSTQDWNPPHCCSHVTQESNSSKTDTNYATDALEYSLPTHKQRLTQCWPHGVCSRLVLIIDSCYSPFSSFLHSFLSFGFATFSSNFFHPFFFIRLFNCFPFSKKKKKENRRKK